MARKRRIYGPPGCYYTVHCRINDTESMRFQDRRIVKMIFEVLKEAKEKFGFQLCFATIMGNHDHKKLRPNNEIANISKVMHWINFQIAMRYNKLTGHKGRIWRERFKSYVIHDWVYFLNSAGYIARNPERAEIAPVSEYPFGTAIFLYKLLHPFKEFEKFRNLCEEPYNGYFAEIKRTIEAQRIDEKLSKGCLVAPKLIDRPR